MVSTFKLFNFTQAYGANFYIPFSILITITIFISKCLSYTITIKTIACLVQKPFNNMYMIIYPGIYKTTLCNRHSGPFAILGRWMCTFPFMGEIIILISLNGPDGFKLSHLWGGIIISSSLNGPDGFKMSH